ncbi:MAG TPA: hypothetical protein VJ777_12190 [Mycobacterium sp.]|nr:hypothetical protein [Mycobacterium sp.]
MQANRQVHPHWGEVRDQDAWELRKAVDRINALTRKKRATPVP